MEDGSGRAHLVAGVRWTTDTVDAGTVRHTLTATGAVAGLATGAYSAPSASVSFSPAELLPAGPGAGAGHEPEYLGFAFTQFAMPVVAGPELDFDFHPAPNLRSPRAILPLLGRRGPRTVLLAPIDNAHEQIVTVRDGRIVWGWHGDLDEVPDGFRTTLGVFLGGSPTEVLRRWAATLVAAAPAHRPDPSTRPVLSHLSYWTDNGAAYWYRTEPARTIAESVADAVERLREDGVPVRAIELDSWFYPHEVSRPITEIGYPEDVPPSGALRWEPRPDAFAATTEPGGEHGSDPLERFADRLGRPPLVLHARHVSPRSPEVGTDAEGRPSEWWIDDLAAQPADPRYFRRWLLDARRWGATCVEQDWMLLSWFGVRELRRRPGRARAWQETLDALAAELDLDLLWCMATPADLVLATGLDRVVAVRTSDDYRFAEDPALLWTWFLTVNRLVAPLGLRPFKDCFLSNPDVGPDDDPIDGDRHAELEALLAALSTGPVGIGDRIGRTSREIVLRTCDGDGRLLRPDAPIGLIDDCLFGAPARGERLAWATTSTTVEDRTWTYVVAVNTAAEARPVRDSLPLAELGVDGLRYVYDWRVGVGHTADRIDVELAPRDWAYHVCCPIVGGRAVVGDPTKYATMAAWSPQHPRPRRASDLVDIDLGDTGR